VFVFVDAPNQDHLFKKDVFPHVLFFDLDCLKTLIEEFGLNIEAISGYGREMSRSPINDETANKIIKKMAGAIYRARFVLPSRFTSAFFSWYFGSNRENAQGTWLRAVARKPLAE
jgi:hypothetical protein